MRSFAEKHSTRYSGCAADQCFRDETGRPIREARLRGLLLLFVDDAIEFLGRFFELDGVVTSDFSGVMSRRASMVSGRLLRRSALSLGGRKYLAFRSSLPWTESSGWLSVEVVGGMSEHERDLTSREAASRGAVLSGGADLRLRALSTAIGISRCC